MELVCFSSPFKLFAFLAQFINLVSDFSKMQSLFELDAHHCMPVEIWVFFIFYLFQRCKGLKGKRSIGCGGVPIMTTNNKESVVSLLLEFAPMIVCNGVNRQ